jgi:hypothetical protein
MRATLYSAFGHEFITVSGESRPGLPPDAAARDLFARFTTELNAHGLSLDDTVRTRLWGRDRAARDGGSGARVRILSGKARSASSSYISPRHFDSAGAVAVSAVRCASALWRRVAISARYCFNSSILITSCQAVTSFNLGGNRIAFPLIFCRDTGIDRGNFLHSALG